MKNETKNKTIKELIVSLGIEPKDIKIYEAALTHRSFLNENRKDKSLSHNERLEFLGDAVLELIISEYLFHKYPDRPEGELTSFRAATVKTDTLAEVAKELDYGSYLQMSHGEEATGGRNKDYLLANTFEAILGAIYLDQGYAVCKDFISRILIPRIETIVKNRLDIDAKTKFQEEAQAQFKMTPTYKVLEEIGPDHDKRFVMGVFLGEQEYGKGEGASKQRAEEAAAKEALDKLETAV